MWKRTIGRVFRSMVWDPKGWRNPPGNQGETGTDVLIGPAQRGLAAGKSVGNVYAERAQAGS